MGWRRWRVGEGFLTSGALDRLMQQAAPASVFDVFDALPDPAAILASDGVLLRANAAFRRAFKHLVGPHRPEGKLPLPRFDLETRDLAATAMEILTRDAMACLCAENLLAGLRGDPLPHWVNPEAANRRK